MLESFSKKKKLGGAIQTMHRPGCNLVISFRFSAQDIDLEYLFWQQKNSSVSSDLKPPFFISLELYQAEKDNKNVFTYYNSQ